MATMVIQIRSNLMTHCTRPIVVAHLFSSSFASSSSAPPAAPAVSPDEDRKSTLQKGNNEDASSSSASSYFSEIKARLRQSSPPPRPPAQSSLPPSPPRRLDQPFTKTPSLEEIRKNLTEFRRVYSAQDPKIKTSSGPPLSFQEIYENNVSKSSDTNAEKAKTLSLEAIRESLRRMPKVEPPTGPRFQTPGTRTISPSLIKSLKDTISRPKESPASAVLPSSIFQRELEQEKQRETSSTTQQTEFLRMYSHKELGEKLRRLRPEGVESENWFSLDELNERLKKLREIEVKESESRVSGISYRDLRESLFKLQEADANKKKATAPHLFLSSLSGTLPQAHTSLKPKPHLLEKYLHPDNMSSEEKLKLELKRVRDEFKMSESDCGSSRVQIAQLSTKIKYLSSMLHKKDKHSRRGLEQMVQRRKKLLKYLQRTDWDSYCFVLSKLGLRDNPVYKY